MSNPAERIKLGRLPYGVLGTVDGFEFDGETLSLAGRVKEVAADTDEERAALVAVRREQLLGVGSPWDTQWLPIVTDDPSLTGIYADPSVSVDADYPGVGHFRWRLRCRRVLGRDAPGIEVEQIGGLRSNSHSITAADVTPWVAVPSAVTDFYAGAASGSTFSKTRSTDTGSVGIYRYATTGINRRTLYARLPVADWFDGAGLIEVGSDRHPVTGRQLWDTDAASNQWRVGNGLIRVSQGTTAGTLLVEHYYGGTWASNTYSLAYDSAAKTIDSMTTFTVLVNTPEVVSVRVGLRSGSYLHRHLLDITVRRGSLMADFIWRTDEALLGRITRSSPAGASKLTTGGGADYGLGNSTTSAPRWVMMMTAAQDEDTTNEWIERTTDGTAWAFGIGASNSDTTASGLKEEWFGLNEAYQTVVAR